MPGFMVRGREKIYDFVRNHIISSRTFLLFITALLGFILAEPVLNFIYNHFSLSYENRRIADYLAITSIPVLYVLWFFRTRDTKESTYTGIYNKAADLLLTGMEELKNAPDTSKDNEHIRRTNFLLLNKIRTRGFLIEEINLVTSSGLDLSGVDLSKEYMAGANLTGADLANAALIKTNLAGANLTSATLTDAKLEKANLIETNLTEAKLRQGILTVAALIKATLVEADMREAILMKADLTKANLTDTDLTGADLRGADLTGANLTRIKFKGTIYSKSTKGFNPEDYADLLILGEDKDENDDE